MIGTTIGDPMKNGSTNHHVDVENPRGVSRVVVVCEHASFSIPDEFSDLGLNGDALLSHVAWDPGALGVARGLSKKLDACLVSSKVSRLVYDCNRPPSAHDAMPTKSEIFDVPGNVALTPAERQHRVDAYYEPFRANLAAALSAKDTPILLTIHSFTPIYHGLPRTVEIGVLHDSDTRLADAMLANMTSCEGYTVQRNEPYGPEHGVTHTLKEHALDAGHLNVMLEIRNDLIQSAAQQDAMAQTIAHWLTAAFNALEAREAVQC
jgi:predicted N-formylglutamate amidohydrolase